MVKVTATVVYRRPNNVNESTPATLNDAEVKIETIGSQVRLTMLSREGVAVAAATLSEPAAEVLEQSIKTARRVAR